MQASQKYRGLPVMPPISIGIIPIRLNTKALSGLIISPPTVSAVIAKIDWVKFAAIKSRENLLQARLKPLRIPSFYPPFKANPALSGIS